MSKSEVLVGKQRPDKPKKRRSTNAKQRAASVRNMKEFRKSIGGRATHQTHGISLVINSNGKELPAIPDAAEIRETVQRLLDATIVDLGGEPEITGTQRAILESQRLALTVLALGARHLAAEGIVDRKSRKPQGLLAVLGVYMNGVRLNSLALGLERKAKFAGTLESHLQSIADRERREEADVSDSEKSDEPEPGAAQ
jgi:hypothetical protein